MYFTKYDFGLVYIIIEPDDLSSDEQGDWGVEQSVASGESSKFIWGSSTVHTHTHTHTGTKV